MAVLRGKEGVMELAEGENHGGGGWGTKREREIVLSRMLAAKRKTKSRSELCDHPLIGTPFSLSLSLSLLRFFSSSQLSPFTLSDHTKREKEKGRKEEQYEMMLWKKRRKKNVGMRVAARQRKITRVFEEEERESRRGHGGEREQPWKLKNTAEKETRTSNSDYNGEWKRLNPGERMRIWMYEGEVNCENSWSLSAGYEEAKDHESRMGLGKERVVTAWRAGSRRKLNLPRLKIQS